MNSSFPKIHPGCFGDVVDALGDAFGFAVAEAVFDHGVAVGGVEFADGVFDAGELDGGDAEFFDAEADEEGGEADVAGHFSADAGPDAVLVRSEEHTSELQSR